MKAPFLLLVALLCSAVLPAASITRDSGTGDLILAFPTESALAFSLQRAGRADPAEFVTVETGITRSPETVVERSFPGLERAFYRLVVEEPQLFPAGQPIADEAAFDAQADELRDLVEFGGGSSRVLFNWQPPLDESDTFVEDDGATTEVTRVFGSFDPGFVVDFPALGSLGRPADGAAESVNGEGFGLLNTMQPPASVRFGGAQVVTASGATGSQPLTVTGNTISIGNGAFEVDLEEYLPVSDPSLAAQLRSSLRNPPDPVSGEQIASACPDGALFISNSRLVAFRERRVTTATVHGTTTMEITSYDFVYEYLNGYVCETGDRSTSITVRFSCRRERFLNGALVDVDFATARYRYTPN